MNIAAANMVKRVGARMHPIIVWDNTGELVAYQNSHCHVSMQAFQDSNTFRGTSHFFTMAHRALRFTESNALVKSTKAMKRLRCCSLAFSREGCAI